MKKILIGTALVLGLTSSLSAKCEMVTMPKPGGGAETIMICY
ncbi:hypothetical protein ThvES_00011120 [Thiovulum sp. ES]|nr:hypothetical protein ThvES_00011120 [Thiovulum sp. ES]